MRVSVALCTYNGEKFLPAQLQSLLDQEQRPDELVVADDGSKDGTRALVADFAARAPFAVSVLDPGAQPLGVTGNFERALAACTGDVLLPCDQDDVWLPAKIERLVRPFLDSRVQLVCTNATLVNAEGRPLGGDLWSALEFGADLRRRVAAGSVFEVLCRRNFASGMAMAVRSAVARRARPYPSLWYFDGWIALWAAALGTVCLEEGPLVLYRQHGANQIGARKRGVLDHVRQATQVKSGDILHLCEQMKLARARLADDLAPTRRAFLDEWIDHLAARAALPRSRARRLQPILRELAAGRYRRHSNGVVSALGDAIFKRV